MRSFSDRRSKVRLGACGVRRASMASRQARFSIDTFLSVASVASVVSVRSSLRSRRSLASLRSPPLHNLAGLLRTSCQALPPTLPPIVQPTLPLILPRPCPKGRAEKSPRSSRECLEELRRNHRGCWGVSWGCQGVPWTGRVVLGEVGCSLGMSGCCLGMSRRLFLEV